MTDVAGQTADKQAIFFNLGFRLFVLSQRIFQLGECLLRIIGTDNRIIADEAGHFFYNSYILACIRRRVRVKLLLD